MAVLQPIIPLATVYNFLTAIKAEVSNAGNSKVDSQLRLALKHALSRVSHLRAPWTEAEFSFTTTIGVSAYDSTTSGFPKDAAELDVVEVQETGDDYIECRPASILEIRRQVRGAAGTNETTPSSYCWYAQSLMFGAGFQTAKTVRGYYHRDARRDSVTGNLIEGTPVSDGYINAWMQQGEDLLWAKTLEIYHARFAVDGERMAYYAAQARFAAEGIGTEWARKAAAGMQVEGHF